MDFRWFRNKYIVMLPWLPFFLAIFACLFVIYSLSQKKEAYNLRYTNYANLIRKIECKKVYCGEYYSNLFPNKETKKQQKIVVKQRRAVRIHLKGILQIDNSKIALINEFAYHEGDLIAPKTSLFEIRDNYVLITIDREIKKLGLGEELEINET